MKTLMALWQLEFKGNHIHEQVFVLRRQNDSRKDSLLLIAPLFCLGPLTFDYIIQPLVGVLLEE